MNVHKAKMYSDGVLLLLCEKCGRAVDRMRLEEFLLYSREVERTMCFDCEESPPPTLYENRIDVPKYNIDAYFSIGAGGVASLNLEVEVEKRDDNEH